MILRANHYHLVCIISNGLSTLFEGCPKNDILLVIKVIMFGFNRLHIVVVERESHLVASFFSKLILPSTSGQLTICVDGVLTHH